MNKLTIIGNLTKDPEVRQVQTRDGSVSCCDFTVAVNARKKGDAEAVFFRCTAWRGIAEIIGRYASKGKKVCVIGPVSARAYTGRDSKPYVSIDVQVEDFEFVSPRGDADETGLQKDGFVAVADEDVPF